MLDPLTVRSEQILQLGVGLGVTHQLLKMNDSGLNSEAGRVVNKMLIRRGSKGQNIPESK